MSDKLTMGDRCHYDITCDYEEKLREAEHSLAALRKKAGNWRRDAETFYQEVINLQTRNKLLLEALEAALPFVENAMAIKVKHVIHKEDTVSKISKAIKAAKGKE